ncbi:MAG: metalloregulator ArsR/SmtB family transcription factor [Planctomycetota bacterium]
MTIGPGRRIILTMATSLPPLDGVFAALAHPARRAMVERLVRGEAATGELAERHEMTLSAVLQHLEVLRSAGVVASEKRGRVRVFRLRPEVLEGANRWFADQQARFWKAGLAAMDAALKEKDRG